MKFNTILKNITIFLLITYSLSLSIQKTESEKKIIPRISDIQKQHLLENSARKILEDDLLRSDVEKNPSRYQIMSAADAERNDMTGAKIYEKDSKAYYGAENPNPASNKMSAPFEHLENNGNYQYSTTPKISPEANKRYVGKDIYYLDQKPYYGTGREYNVVSNVPKGVKAVPIQLDSLKNTYADPNNVSALENDLKKLTEKESLTSISLSGKYYKDPNAYYDPAADERNAKIATISNTIQNMKNELKSQEAKGPVFTEENFKVKTRIQNYVNLNRENTNEFIKNSYYYDVKRNEKPTTMTVFDQGQKVHEKKRNLVEADVVAERLGSKYVNEENRKTLNEAIAKKKLVEFKNLKKAENKAAPVQKVQKKAEEEKGEQYDRDVDVKEKKVEKKVEKKIVEEKGEQYDRDVDVKEKKEEKKPSFRVNFEAGFLKSEGNHPLTDLSFIETNTKKREIDFTHHIKTEDARWIDKNNY